MTFFTEESEIPVPQQRVDSTNHSLVGVRQQFAFVCDYGDQGRRNRIFGGEKKRSMITCINATYIYTYVTTKKFRCLGPVPKVS